MEPLAVNRPDITHLNKILNAMGPIIPSSIKRAHIDLLSYTSYIPCMDGGVLCLHQIMPNHEYIPVPFFAPMCGKVPR